MPKRSPILQAVSKKYQLPYWVFIEQFRDATGFDSSRSADALAVGLYRSRGLHVIGFEQKVSRSDWLRELKNPEKAEAVGQFCDFFYLVVNDKSIAKLEELPTPWGLICVEDGKVKYLKKAEQLQAAPIPRYFLAAIVKQAMDTITKPAANERQTIRDEVWQEAFTAGQRNAGHDEAKAEALRKKVEEFEQASGIRINQYGLSGAQLGEAVKVVLEAKRGQNDYTHNLRFQMQQVERLVSQLQDGLKALESLTPQTSPTV